MNKTLQAARYSAREPASVGLFDVIATGPFYVKLIQVRAGDK